MNSEDPHIQTLLTYYLILVLRSRDLAYLAPETAQVLTRQAIAESVDPETRAGQERLFQLAWEAGLILLFLHRHVLDRRVRPEIDAIVSLQGVVAGICAGLPRELNPNREKDRLRIVLRTYHAVHLARAIAPTVASLVAKLKLYDRVDPRMAVTLTAVEAVLAGVRLEMPRGRVQLRAIAARHVYRLRDANP